MRFEVSTALTVKDRVDSAVPPSSYIYIYIFSREWVTRDENNGF
jgi:hypothetical protein